MTRSVGRAGRQSPAHLATMWTRGLLVVTVAVMAVQAVRNLSTADAGHVISGVVIACYLVWLGSEIPITFRTPAQPVAEGRTLAIYASVRALLVLTAVLPSTPWSAWSGWMLPPIGLFVAGVLLRMLAIRALGTHYTHHVLRRAQHRLVTTGPYRWVRHPAYAGMLLANLGFVLFFHHVASIAALVLLVGVLAWRLRTEERVLWSVPGYPEFAAARARMLPGVW